MFLHENIFLRIQRIFQHQRLRRCIACCWANVDVLPFFSVSPPQNSHNISSPIKRIQLWLQDLYLLEIGTIHELAFRPLPGLLYDTSFHEHPVSSFFLSTLLKWHCLYLYVRDHRLAFLLQHGMKDNNSVYSHILKYVIRLIAIFQLEFFLEQIILLQFQVWYAWKTDHQMAD